MRSGADRRRGTITHDHVHVSFQILNKLNTTAFHLFIHSHSALSQSSGNSYFYTYTLSLLVCNNLCTDSVSVMFLFNQEWS